MVTTENSLDNIPWLRRNIPWTNQILFSRGTPPTREFPGEYSMVTTEYSLVKSNFIFQGTPTPTREFPGEYSMVTTEYSLENIPCLQRSIPWSNEILFSKGPPPHARIPWRIFHSYDGVFPGQIKFYFPR